MSNQLYEKLAGQHRMYYDSDWHCDCDHHTVESDIDALKNIFSGTYHEVKVSYDEGTGNYYVNGAESCVLSTSIRDAEFHGLMLSSIHSEHHGQFTGIGFIFKRMQYWKEST